MGRTRIVKCLLVGEAETSEFRPVAAWIRRQGDSISVPHISLPLTAPVSLAAFQVIVLLQSRPGQFSSAGIDSLHRAWPLARLVTVLGSWCEGVRSGRQYPGVWRMPVSSAIFRLRSLFSGAPSRVTPPGTSRSWQLPRLATEAERLESEASRAFRALIRPAPVVIVAASRDAFDPLADLVSQAQFASIWRNPREIAAGTTRDPSLHGSVVIWDAVRGDDREWEQIRRFAASIDLAAILILLGFVRSGDLSQASSISSSATSRTPHTIVIPKPFYAGDLIEELVRTTDTIDRTGVEGKGNKSQRFPGENEIGMASVLEANAPPSKTA